MRVSRDRIAFIATHKALYFIRYQVQSFSCDVSCVSPFHSWFFSSAASAAARLNFSSCAPAEFSYQISPYRENSDSESEEDDARPRKPIPGWAHSDQLAPCLYRQAKVDPDEIFVNPSKTCSLDAVFATRASSKSRRSSSGNWFHDRLTWKEEVSYKREMGFINSSAGRS